MTIFELLILKVSTHKLTNALEEKNANGSNQILVQGRNQRTPKLGRPESNIKARFPHHGLQRFQECIVFDALKASGPRRRVWMILEGTSKSH